MKAVTDALSVSRSNQYEQMGKEPAPRRSYYHKAEDNSKRGRSCRTCIETFSHNSILLTHL
jgi:hypothetical protein